LKLEVDKLYIKPCLPSDWQSYKIHYRYRETIYHITIIRLNSNDIDLGITVDGIKTDNKAISLIDDRKEHLAEVRIALPGNTFLHL
jgi:cellobiose phosphorylase